MIGKILILLLPIAAFLGGSAGGAMIRGDGAASAESHDEAALSEGAGAPAEASDHGAEADAAPAKATAAKAKGHGDKKGAHGGGSGEKGDGAEAWFSFPSQFFVPVVRNSNTDYIMILTLTLETPGEALPAVEALEHRLRDAILRQLIIHANSGGFDGNYTSDGHLRRLRDGLLTAARTAGGDNVSAVLIEDIARKDG